MFLIKAWLFPPGLIIILILLGLVSIKRYPLLTKIYYFLLAAILYFASTKVGTWLLSEYLLAANVQAIELNKITTPSDKMAIVVLGAGRYYNAKEYKGDTIASGALQRARYAAILHKQTQYPILVSGGRFCHEKLSEANLLAKVLQTEFSSQVKWQEDNSKNTYENAQHSAAMLKANNINNIVLVTDSTHMTRALRTFKHFGLNVHAAPTRIINSPYFSAMLAWQPSASNLENSSYILREWVGGRYYKYKYNIPLSYSAAH